MGKERVYSGMTAEQRHQDRRTRLIDAAIELMGERGASNTTVTAVCAKSRVTTRYFYQYFSDRDGLLRAVFEKLEATMRDTLVAAVPKTFATPDELAKAPVRALVAMINDDRRLARILFIESGTEPTLRLLRGEFMVSLADLTTQLSRLHLKIPEAASRVGLLAATMGVGGLFEVFRRWLDGELVFTTDELVEHCAGFLGSLGTYVLENPATGDVVP
ncbi:TetR/AcrR family transcriptional regulator [Mycolicibacterium sediminis]|uniref:TetR/AcrR family transcriptional regulator n=1 Tax=Mycolicibacterium sediminis TaxID=1286180 RepID=UPI0018D6D760|nr:TetR/AcrR family transcriptional regulator [Mycolicibacterium sediminis]